MSTWDDTLGGNVIQAPVGFTGSGDNTIVFGVAGKLIKVVGLFFIVSDSVNLKFKSGATPLTGLLSMFPGGSFYRDLQHLPLNCISQGDSFVINADASITLGGTIWYIVS